MYVSAYLPSVNSEIGYEYVSHNNGDILPRRTAVRDVVTRVAFVPFFVMFSLEQSSDVSRSEDGTATAHL
jgi:hypothetical protein